MAVVQRLKPQPAEAAEPNPRVAMGNNRPPLDVEARAAFDDALNQREGFRERVTSLLASASRAFATDEESTGKCGELVKQLRAAMKVVEDAHTTTKAPYLAAGRAVDAAKNEVHGKLDDARKTVEAKQTTFLREENARQEAAARRAREVEQARLAEQREREQAELARIAAESPEAPPPTPEPAPLPPPVQIEPERTFIRGDFGAAVSGKKEWLSQVTDYEVAFMAVSNNDKVREAIDKAIASMVRGGLHQIEGVRIWQDVKVSNR